MSNAITPSELKRVLDALAADLESVRIRIPESRHPSGEQSRRSLLADIRTYFDGRLEVPGAPVVVAVMGPSGVGVSSVVNALVGEPVSPTGVLRPTTRTPVVWAPHGAAGRWWDDVKRRYTMNDQLEVAIGGPGTEKREWVVVDVPAAVGPSESLDLAGRADVCVFVSSPARYADAEAAATAVGLFERGVPTWYVMNKLPEDPVLRFETVEAYAGLLHSWDLIERPSPDLIETAARTSGGAVVRGDLGRLRALLASLGDDADRAAFFEDAFAARLAAVGVRAEEIAEAIEDDRDALLDLTAVSVDAYSEIADQLTTDLENGAFAGLASHPSWLEAAVDLSGILTRRAGLAAGRTTEAWYTKAPGRAVLADGGGTLRRHGEDAAYESQGLLEAWFEELGDLGAGAANRRVTKRRKAKSAAALWPLIVDPRRDAPRRLARRLGVALDRVTTEGRARLSQSIAAALERDRARFDAFLGPLPDVARLGRIIAAASRLGVVEVTGFGGRTFTWEHEASVVPPAAAAPATAAPEPAEPAAPTVSDTTGAAAAPPADQSALRPEVLRFELPEVPDAPPQAPATAFGLDALDEMDSTTDPIGGPDRPNGDDHA